MRVWQESKDLAVIVYKITAEGEFSRDFGLRDQLRRSAVSIPSNIAEGERLQSDKQAVNHFYHTRSSAAELETQLMIAREIGYMNQADFDVIRNKCDQISGMLTNLIKSRK